MDHEERFLSVEEIVPYLGVSKRSIYRLIKEKGLPAYKIGKLIRLKKTEVEKWLKSNNIKGASYE